MLPLVAIAVAMFLGGISGSGPANAAAVGGVMIAAMNRAGYPASYSASVVGAAAATDILIPPSVAFIIYSVLVPGASVPALFAAGMIPGVLAGLALIVPAVWMARAQDGPAGGQPARPPILKSFIESIWGLLAPVVILGGMRMGWFTPTEAAVVAVFYGLFVGMVIHRTMTWRDVIIVLKESGELSAVILIVVALAGIFAFSLSTLGVIDPITNAIVNSGLGEYGVLSLLILMLITVGMFLDGVSIFLIFVPLLWPIVEHYQWDPVVRRAADAEGGAGPVHAAAGGQPDGVVPHRQRAHGADRALGVADAAGHGPGAGGRHHLAAAGAVAAACAGLLMFLGVDPRRSSASS
jgi:tripartite ATP-independent transporter DctM subunit